MEVKVPDLKSYADYRAFLRDYYEHRKVLRPGFSYRRFAQLVGVRSPNYLQLVMKGERNLSVALAERVAKVMELSKDERAYFVVLVGIGLAETPQERVDAHKKRLVALKKLLTRYVNAAHSAILEEWHYLLVRELVFLPGFKPEGGWMSERLSGIVTPKQAETSFHLLIKGGFVVTRSKGKYAVADPVLDTGDRVFTRALNLKHHAETLQQWGRSRREFERVAA